MAMKQAAGRQCEAAQRGMLIKDQAWKGTEVPRTIVSRFTSKVTCHRYSESSTAMEMANLQWMSFAMPALTSIVQ